MGIFETLKSSINRRGINGTASRLMENFFPDMGHILSAPSTIVHEDMPRGRRIPVIDRLMKRTENGDGQQAMWKAVATLPPGTYATRERVGRTAEGTGHSHFFVVDRDETGATFLFVDSEANINASKREKGQALREGDLRPQVCNLMAVRMKNGEEQPDIAMTRFRTEKITDPAALSFESLLAFTRELFTNKGVPQELEEVRNEEVVFRLILEPSREEPMLVQTRDTDDVAALRAFLQGQDQGSPTLRGQIRSAAALLTGEFTAHLERGDLKAIPHSARTS